MTLAEKWEQRGIEKGLEKVIQQGLQQGKQEGLQEGRHAERLEVARSMLLEGIGNQTVAKITGLSEEDLSQLLN